MLSTPEPLQLEPDARTHEIAGEPSPGECGAYAFGRDIALHLEGLLRTPVTRLAYRRNPPEHQPVPKAQSYQLAVAGHTVLITVFEVKPALAREPRSAYAIALDGIRVPFEPDHYAPSAWQLARTAWIAITDRQIAAEHAARQTVDAANPAAGQGVQS